MSRIEEFYVLGLSQTPEMNIADPRGPQTTGQELLL
jgi:hypothetical protein